MRAIILSAGQGTRLRPHTDSLPKCLLDIGGISVLEHQLGNCLAAGIRDVAVVTGFQFQKVDECIARALEGRLAGLAVETVYNPFFDVSNNLVSLWSARHRAQDGFILINGDDVFTPRILSMLTAHTGRDITVSMDKKASYDDDDMKIVLDEQQRITAINKTIPADQAHGESIGIMKFTARGAARLLQELETMVRLETGMKDWYTKSIERIAQSGFDVGVASVAGMPWAEIDFPEDLEHVRRTASRYAS